MRSRLRSHLCLIALCSSCLCLRAQGPQAVPASSAVAVEQASPKPSDDYALGPDSIPQPGVPRGETFDFRLDDSKIFPNTSRTISVYVPGEYTAREPACVYVGLDGIGFNAPVVFDNLIARHAMPVTIAIGISPGTVAAGVPSGSQRYDRSFEFDSRTGRLAAFVLDEVLPAVSRRTASGGRALKLSTNPDCRMIAGSSTGGIAAFNVAWQRPDAFHRVFSSIGTFVGMRGGEGFYVEVRKTEPKPIRVFLQDGAFDQWPGGPEMGDWWMSNQTMERALSFAGYDVRHAWGNGTHNGAHAAAIFPEAMQWLWRDFPVPVNAGASGNPALQAILQPAAGWRTAAEHCPGAHLAAAPDGNVFYAGAGGKPVQLGATAMCAAPAAEPIAFDAQGTAYTGTSDGVVRWEARGQTPVAKLGRVRDVLAMPGGSLYATTEAGAGSAVWLIRTNGSTTRVADGLQEPSGLAVMPDKGWLFVAQGNGRYGCSLRVRPDGTLDSADPFFDFFVPASSFGSQAGSLATDIDGRTYAATAAGVQIFDHNGRVIAILPLPGDHAAVSLCFAGEGFRTLYVSDGERVYARTLKVSGRPSWMPATATPNWGEG